MKLRITGKDAEQALAELHSNIEFDNLEAEVTVLHQRRLTTAYDPADDADLVAKHLKAGYVAFDQEAVFDDGCFMAIRVVADPSDSSGFWTEGVLFDKTGCERACTEVGESLYGE